MEWSIFQCKVLLYEICHTLFQENQIILHFKTFFQYSSVSILYIWKYMPFRNYFASYHWEYYGSGNYTAKGMCSERAHSFFVPKAKKVLFHKEIMLSLFFVVVGAFHLRTTYTKPTGSCCDKSILLGKSVIKSRTEDSVPGDCREVIKVSRGCLLWWWLLFYYLIL